MIGKHYSSFPHRILHYRVEAVTVVPVIAASTLRQPPFERPDLPTVRRKPGNRPDARLSAGSLRRGKACPRRRRDQNPGDLLEIVQPNARPDWVVERQIRSDPVAGPRFAGLRATRTKDSKVDRSRDDFSLCKYRAFYTAHHSNQHCRFFGEIQVVWRKTRRRLH